jgi:hypothetical protein
MAKFTAAVLTFFVLCGMTTVATQPIGKARKSPRVFRLEWSLSVSRKLLILRHCNSLRHGLMFLMSF